ncbi:hypothetical protein GFY24_17235 [Nocardia sp. SYP-A9097]|uniref:hypothetical protein n=1 Tax=Nocardia sp. SYP-A9097 TaxID=2663237 RepID=UPI00129A4A9C|nr:hypothetical protein [Nocardia sp. SYP-A9097]MRH89173.1 hypothetical protein [Nocardia sp. SYP-A9097]
MTGGARSASAAALAVLAVAAAFTGLAAPAGATGTQVGAEPGQSFGLGTNYGTGCSYAINGYVDDPSTPVVFYDNGIQFAVAKPSGRLAIGRWTPATPGAHRITIIQHSMPGEDVIPWLDLTVGTGLPTGSGCGVFF